MDGIEFENKMIETLESIEVHESLLFEDPYECLSVFTSHIIESKEYAKKIHKKNIEVETESHELKLELQKMKDQAAERIRKEEEAIRRLNELIDQKKEELKDLELNYQQVLKAKAIAEKELQETQDQMKIMRLKLYEEQREKLTEIIVANKNEMLEFRKALEMESYKQEVEFRRQLEKREREVKELTKNIEEIATNKLSSSTDFTVLERILRPLRESNELKENIESLESELSQVKKQSNQRVANVLKLEGKLADVIKIRDNFKSYSERLQIEKEQVLKSKQELQKEYDKCEKDRYAVETYYNQKWTREFEKVKDQLEKKHIAKIQSLEKQFDRKTKEIEQSIISYQDEARILRLRIHQVTSQNKELGIEISDLKEEKQSIVRKLEQEKRQYLESIRFAEEDLRGQKLRFKVQGSTLRSQIEALQRSLENQRLNSGVEKRSLESRMAEQLKQWQCRQHLLKQEHKSHIEQFVKKQNELIEQLNSEEAHMKALTDQIREEERKFYEQQQKRLVEQHQRDLEAAYKSEEMKVHRLNERINHIDINYQKLRSKRHEEIKEFENKKFEMKTLLSERQNQLITRDIEIEGYKEHKDTFMNELKEKLKLIEELEFAIESNNTEIEAKNSQIEKLESEIEYMKSRKHEFKEDLKEFRKEYEKEFEQLRVKTKNQLAFYKSKIWELEGILENRPIKKKDYEKIKSLEKYNSELLIQVEVKEAENLVIHQVKDYYINKIRNIGPVTESKLFTEAQPQTQPHLTSTAGGKSLLIRKPTKRNRLVSTSVKFDQSEDCINRIESDEMVNMKKYLESRQRKQTQLRVSSKADSRGERIKSSMA